MNRLVYIFGFMICILLSACSDKTFDNAFQEGIKAIENKDYKKAIASFELALKEKKDDAETKNLLEQTKKMVEALKAQSESNINEAAVLFEEIAGEKDGSNVLKEQATEALKTLKLNTQNKYNNQLAKIEDLKKNKKYAEAKTMLNTVVSETENIEFLSMQNNRAKELLKTIDAEVAKLAAVASAYYRIVNNIINEYGILMEDDELSGESQGLAYSNLIDFDKDGVPELYIIYEKAETDPSYASYIEEIWGYKNGKEAKIYSEEFDNGALVSDAARSIVTVNSTPYLVQSGQYSAGSRGDFPNGSEYLYWDVFFALKNNTFVEVASAHRQEVYFDNGEEKNIYTIKENNKEKRVTKEEYDQFLKKYDIQNRKRVIDSDSGTKSLAFDVSGNEQKINDFIQKLKNDINSASRNNLYSQLTLDEKKELIAFLYHFTGIDSFNIDKYRDVEIINFLLDGSFDGQISEEELPQDTTKEPIVDENGFLYKPYSANKVNELTQKLFGITVAPKSYSEDGFDIAKYKDGYFYILEPDRGGSIEVSSPQVDTLYDLGNGLFYAEFVLYSTEYPVIQDLGLDDKYLLNPIETWSSKEKSVVNRKTSGYTILKEVSENGKKTWRLIRYSTDGNLLTDKEMEAYKKK